MFKRTFTFLICILSISKLCFTEITNANNLEVNIASNGFSFILPSNDWRYVAMGDKDNTSLYTFMVMKRITRYNYSQFTAGLLLISFEKLEKEIDINEYVDDKIKAISKQGRYKTIQDYTNGQEYNVTNSISTMMWHNDNRKTYLWAKNGNEYLEVFIMTDEKFYDDLNDEILKLLKSIKYEEKKAVQQAAGADK